MWKKRKTNGNTSRKWHNLTKTHFDSSTVHNMWQKYVKRKQLPEGTFVRSSSCRTQAWCRALDWSIVNFLMSELDYSPCRQRSWRFNNNLASGCRFNVLPGPEHESRVHIDRGHSPNMANFFGDHPQLLKVNQAIHFRVIPWEAQRKQKMKSDSCHTAQMAKWIQNRKPEINKARMKVRFKSREAAGNYKLFYLRCIENVYSLTVCIFV